MFAIAPSFVFVGAGIMLAWLWHLKNEDVLLVLSNPWRICRRVAEWLADRIGFQDYSHLFAHCCSHLS